MRLAGRAGHHRPPGPVLGKTPRSCAGARPWRVSQGRVPAGARGRSRLPQGRLRGVYAPTRVRRGPAVGGGRRPCALVSELGGALRGNGGVSPESSVWRCAPRNVIGETSVNAVRPAARASPADGDASVSVGRPPRVVGASAPARQTPGATAPAAAPPGLHVTGPFSDAMSFSPQVLLSQVHRLRALDLLGRFLDLGPWAVSLVRVLRGAGWGGPARPAVGTPGSLWASAGCRGIWGLLLLCPLVPFAVLRRHLCGTKCHQPAAL